MPSFTRLDPSEDWLIPQPWALGGEPPGAAVMTSEAMRSATKHAEPPLLLLIEWQRPLAAELMRQLAACLSSEERQRHEAFRLPADRQRFLLGRSALRMLLGAWLGLAPEAVPLESGPHGKPGCLIGPPFNLSHSGDLILLAVHASRPVGVDVERLRPELDWQGLARRLFSEAERLALQRCPAPERPEAFLAGWCRLEARLKARGTGLAGLEALRQQERPAAGERIWNVRVPSGYRAAVALAPERT